MIFYGGLEDTKLTYKMDTIKTKNLEDIEWKLTIYIERLDMENHEQYFEQSIVQKAYVIVRSTNLQ